MVEIDRATLLLLKDKFARQFGVLVEKAAHQFARGLCLRDRYISIGIGATAHAHRTRLADHLNPLRSQPAAKMLRIPASARQIDNVCTCPRCAIGICPAIVGIFTKEKTDIKRGEKGAVAIMLGDNLYVGEGTGMKGNITKGYSGGYVLSDNPQFADDLAKQKVMVVFPEKEFAFTVDLTGTYKAMEMARECNEKQLG